jgi:hypothetical protein
MILLVKWVDLRGGYTTPVAFRTPIVDEDMGREVGFVDAERSPRNRHVSLFGSKYQADFETPEQCQAFAKGVEAVLNHMTAINDDHARQ